MLNKYNKEIDSVQWRSMYRSEKYLRTKTLESKIEKFCNPIKAWFLKEENETVEIIGYLAMFVALAWFFLWVL